MRVSQDWMQLWGVGAVRGTDGVLVRGEDRVEGAGAWRLVLRLVRPDEVPETLIGMFERAQHYNRIAWILEYAARPCRALMFGWERALNLRLFGFRRGVLAPTLRSLDVRLSAQIFALPILVESHGKWIK
jgi:hypothetical protein